jgi:hypothetical protein
MNELKAFCLCGKEIRITDVSKNEIVERERLYSYGRHLVAMSAFADIRKETKVQGVCLVCGDVEITVTTTTKER